MGVRSRQEVFRSPDIEASSPRRRDSWLRTWLAARRDRRLTSDASLSYYATRVRAHLQASVGKVDEHLVAFSVASHVAQHRLKLTDCSRVEFASVEEDGSGRYRITGVGNTRPDRKAVSYLCVADVHFGKDVEVRLISILGLP